MSEAEAERSSSAGGGGGPNVEVGSSSTVRAAEDPQIIGVGLLCAVKADHDKVRALFKEAKGKGLSEDKRDAIMRDIVKELSIHAAIEERVVYPAMKAALSGSDGEKEFTASLHEHQRQKEVLNQLDGMKVADAKWAALFAELRKDTEAHMAEEETDRFPRFLQNVSEKERDALLLKYESAKSTAPSHPHPSAPSKGPLVTAAQIAAAGVDTVRDIGRSAVAAFGATIAQKIQSVTGSAADKKDVTSEQHGKKATDTPEKAK